MTTRNRLTESAPTDRIIPPQGHSPEQKALRRVFWIEHGNDSLRQKGLGHLQWRCVDGNYFIEPR